jgi:hypothetical protein
MHNNATHGDFYGFRNMEQLSENPVEMDFDILRRLKQDYPTKVVIASIMGQTEEEWMALAKMAEEAGCDAVELNGTLYTEDTEVIYSVVDSVEMVDSTLTTYIRIHYAANTALSDTGTAGESYRGHGFYLSATETALFRGALDSLDEVSIILTDTLTTAFGCDSVVTLTLTFHSDGSTEDIVEVSETTEVKVYPNPTVNVVNVDAEQMSHVEIYDNEGRVLQNRDTYDASHVTLDLSYYPSGIYYIRVHTPNRITIQKVIKR